MTSSTFFLRTFFTAGLLLILVGSSTAQTVTGTLYGVAYPSNVVTTGAQGGYKIVGNNPWIVNKPQVSIIGIDTNGQTTFAYHDVYSQNVGVNVRKPVTESGILVQNTAGIYFTEQAKVAPTPVVQSCTIGKAGAATCEVVNGAVTSTITGQRTAVLTFTAVLPALTASKVSQNSKPDPSSSPSRTNQPAETSQSAHTVPVGAIVGAAVGVVVLVGGALAGLLFCRRRRRRRNNISPLRGKIELDPEPAHEGPFMQRESAAIMGNDVAPTTSVCTTAPSSVTETAPTTSTPTTALETPVQRRRRLKQMQATVQQLQRNLSVTPQGGDDPESQIVAQQRQIDMLLEEVERLRAIVTQEEALPAYED